MLAPKPAYRAPLTSEALRSLRGFRALSPAFPKQISRVDSQTQDGWTLDTDAFWHLEFASAGDALAAATLVEALPGVVAVERLAEPRLLTSSDNGDVFPDDPVHLVWPDFTADPQWSLANHGLRGAAARCGPSIAGADIGVSPIWTRVSALRRTFGGQSLDAALRLGSPSVVLGFLDVGILDAHPDLRVLSEFGHDARFSLCPNADWCGDHGTKMSGLAAARTGNALGVAGVCGDCSLLDLTVPACACGDCDTWGEDCLFVSSLWPGRLTAALGADLGVTDAGEERRLLVVNASFASFGYASLESFAALWNAYASGVLVVAATGDHSLTQPSGRAPANVPFVLGVGGSTWEDRFWDTSVSCMSGTNGSTLGARQIDVTAPASGGVVTTFHYPNPNGFGLYAATSGQCSAAAALVSGAAGYLQGYAREQSPLRRTLRADELAGLLTATARVYRFDPTSGATCPSSLCPREMYGSGIVDLENARLVLERGHEWRTVALTGIDAATVDLVEANLVSGADTWREYRVRWQVEIPRHPATTSLDLPARVAWALPLASNAPCSYGAATQRVLFAHSGATDAQLGLDPATGVATITAANFARVVGQSEEPLVPWDQLRVSYAYWPGPSSGRGGPRMESAVPSNADLNAKLLENPNPDAGGPALRAWPNPSRGSVVISLSRGEAQRVGERSATPLILELFDAGGRLVRALEASYAAPSVWWDGRDDAGRDVGAGWYWLRARGATRSKAIPLVRLP